MALSRMIKSRKAAAIAVVVVGTAAVMVATATWSQAAGTTYPAQGGTWSRIEEGLRSRYVVTSPRVGAGSAEGDEPIRSAIRSYQGLLNGVGGKLAVDGVYGPGTAAAVAGYQRHIGIAPTGTLGYKTVKSLLMPVVTEQAAAVGMSSNLLMCHLAAESNLDFGAIGPNGSDLGVAQISLRHNPGVSVAQALDPVYSIRYMAERDANAFKRYKDWKLAVVSYNSPTAANEWRKSGTPSTRAAKYSQRVFEGCV